MKTLLITLLFFFQANAYIPNLGMISDRMVKNNGYGLYIVDQEVVIYAEPRAYVIHEQWLVENENMMRLRVRGLKELEGKLDMTFVYNFNRRYTINESGKKVTSPLSPHFIESLLHFRKANFFANKLVSEGVVSRNTLNQLKKEDLELSSNEYLRLTRHGGVANYFVGTPASVDGKKNPGAWIEQDQFLLRKFRFSDNTEVVSKNFSKNSRGLMFPKDRTLTWGDHTASITVRKVSGASSASRNRVRHASLKPEKEEHLKRKLPDVAIVKDFYNFFR